MSEKQVILLPKQNYFQWVKAAKSYVLKFGPNLTSDPETAARSPSADKTVTIANPPGAYGRDIVLWFAQNAPTLQLDVLDVNTSQEFQQQLDARVAANDQFGDNTTPQPTTVPTTTTTAQPADEGPFTLLWPTDYPVYTQPFGDNPQIYGRFGLPGHEGVDIRAPMNTNIYACADGEVYRVDTDTSKAYGIHIRIQHRDGYKTLYAHLIEALVSVGDKVRAGDLIGKADSTGNSTASHLHLTLKQDGATASGKTNYPYDIIDPTPFLQLPTESQTQPPAGFNWPAGKCLIGLHGRADGPMQEADYEVVKNMRAEAVKLTSTAPPENVDRLLQINPRMFIMVRLFADFKNRDVDGRTFASWVEHDMSRFYDRGVRYFEVHNEPNLQIEGWKSSWQDGREFGQFCIDTINALKPKFPEAKFGYPGLSPGGNISGQRMDSWAFLQQSDDAVRFCDWLACHCYWVDEADRNKDTGGLVYQGFRQRYPDKLLFITEFSNPADRNSHREKGEQYVRYYESLRNKAGMGAAFSFVVSASSYFPHEIWRDEQGNLNEITGIVGGRGNF